MQNRKEKAGFFVKITKTHGRVFVFLWVFPSCVFGDAMIEYLSLAYNCLSQKNIYGVSGVAFAGKSGGRKRGMEICQRMKQVIT